MTSNLPKASTFEVVSVVYPAVSKAVEAVQLALDTFALALEDGDVIQARQTFADTVKATLGFALGVYPLADWREFETTLTDDDRASPWSSVEPRWEEHLHTV